MNIFSSLIYWITKPFGYLLYLCYLPLKDYGLAILMFTFITRVLLFPLAIKQQRSSAEMARMQPKMQALQKKYGKDQKKLQEATMALYQEEGYSPMSGCLPMLIQMPILMILYNVIINPLTYIVGVTSAQVAKIAKYLPAVPAAQKSRPEIYYAKLLANQDTVNNLIQQHGVTFLNHIHPVNFYLFGIHSFDLSNTPTMAWNIYLLIPVLCYLTQALMSWLTTRMNASVTPQTAQTKSMNVSMTLFMPLISVFFSFSLPSAMGIYWIYTNIFVILQVMLLNKFYHPLKLAKEAEERAQKRREERLRAGLISPQEQKLLEDDADEKQAPKKSGKSAQNGKSVKSGRNAAADKQSQQAAAVKKMMRPAGKNGHYTKSQLKRINRQRLAAARKRDEEQETK